MRGLTPARVHDISQKTVLINIIGSIDIENHAAVKCYIYLSDVSTSNVISLVSLSLSDSSPFRHSKWFTRGWTLQELLAPSSVEFFSNEKDSLGNKRTLELYINDVTGITIKALRRTPMSYFSLNE